MLGKFVCLEVHYLKFVCRGHVKEFHVLNSLFPSIYWFYVSFPLCVPVSPHVATVHMNVDNGGIVKPKCEIPRKKRLVVISHDLWYLCPLLQ